MPRKLSAIRVLYFFFFAAVAVYTVYINVYYYKIGMSGVQIGWINSLAPLISILGSPPLAMLSDRWRRPRLMMAVAAAGLIAAVLGLSAVRVFVWVLPLAGMWSLFNNFLEPALEAANLAMLPGQNEDYGRQRVWGTVGYIVASLVSGVVFEVTGLSWMFISYFILMLVTLACIPTLPAAPALPHSDLRINMRGLVTQPAWLFFAASLIPLWIAVNGMYAFLSVYLTGMRASASLIGSVSSVGALTEVPVMLFSAFLVRRLGLRKMLVTAYAVFGLRMLLYGLMPAPGWSLPITLTHGLTFGLFWVAGVIYINELTPENLRSTSQTLFFAIINLAGVIGAPAGGWVLDNLGGGVLFQMYAVLCALGLLILLAGFRFSRAR